MTSSISKDDLEDELYRCGIKSVIVRQHLMRLIELYARKYPGAKAEAPPVDVGDFQGYKYKCPKCEERKHIGDFPAYKKENKRSPIPCTECLNKPAGLTVQHQA